MVAASLWHSRFDVCFVILYKLKRPHWNPKEKSKMLLASTVCTLRNSNEVTEKQLTALKRNPQCIHLLIAPLLFH